MSDTKISALTSATTPLAGTEVLPIVQSSTTVKVAVNDLTVRNIRAAATTGILQVSGPTAGTTRVMTVPDANFTAARTDAAQSFTGDQTLSTGNLIQGTAAKGINFTANTSAAGMTSQLLNYYEAGTWTPTLTNWTGTLASYVCYYTRVGRLVHVWGVLVPTTTFITAVASSYVSGIPFNAVTDGPIVSWATGYTGQATSIIVANRLYTPTVASTASNFYFSCTYNV
jgi:hypothetical protein